MKLVKMVVLLSVSVLVAGFMTACSSSEEISDTQSKPEMEEAVFERVDKEESIIPETDVPDTAAPAPAAKPQTTVPVQPRDFPAAQETPATKPPTTVPQTSTPPPPQQQQQQPDQPASTGAPRSGAMMWSVQLGAFKSESGALQLIDEVKQKFNQPVYKRYDAVTGFYKVTLGSYQNREEAARFKLDVQSRGYPDAFVVEVAR